MLKLKTKEIEKLEEYAFMREDGLNCSEKMLDQDTRSFVDFFRDNREKCNHANQIAEKKTKERQAKMQELKDKNDEIQTIVSTINKHMENLGEYYEFMEFLDKIAPKEYQDEKKRKLEAKKKKREQRQKLPSLGKGPTKESDFADVEVHCPAKLKDIIDDSDDEFECYFKDPNELLKLFESLEEKNLSLI